MSVLRGFAPRVIVGVLAGATLYFLVTYPGDTVLMLVTFVLVWAYIITVP